jgi:hypothetical protein
MGDPFNPLFILFLPSHAPHIQKQKFFNISIYTRSFACMYFLHKVPLGFFRIKYTTKIVFQILAYKHFHKKN